MDLFFWNIFKTSGNIEAFMAYREYKRIESDDNREDTRIDNKGEFLG